MTLRARAHPAFAVMLGSFMVMAGIGIARANNEATSMGSLKLEATYKSDDGRVRPLKNAAFELISTTPAVVSCGLETDGRGHATIYARPGRYVLKSRSPVLVVGHRYSWKGNIEIYPAKETSVILSSDNALVQDGVEATADTAPILPGSDPSTPVGASAPLDPHSRNDLVLPRIVHKIEPTFPVSLVGAGIKGKVIVLAVIDENGNVREASALMSTNPGFNDAAVTAIRGWKYEPALQNGKPVAIYYSIRTDFSAR